MSKIVCRKGRLSEKEKYGSTLSLMCNMSYNFISLFILLQIAVTLCIKLSHVERIRQLARRLRRYLPGKRLVAHVLIKL